MKRINIFLYKLKHNKKGLTSIEAVIATFIFLMLFCFLVDLLILSWKFAVIAQTNTQVARIAGIQGGIRSTAPSGWPGGNSNYFTTSEMASIIQDKFQSAGIATNEYDFRVGSGGLGGGSVSSSGTYDYKTEFEVSVRVTYRWDFTSNFIPGNLTHTIQSRRTTMSEWKYNYNNWIGE